MSFPKDLSNEDARQICDWIASLYSPQKILIFGEPFLELVKCSAAAGLNVVTLAQADSQAFARLIQNPGSPETLDLILLTPEAVNHFVDSIGLASPEQPRFHGTVLVLISANVDDDALPNTARLLWKAGFARNLAVQKWIGSRAVLYAFQPGNAAPDALLERYEAELWRLDQLSRKRLDLLGDYRSDIYREISAAEGAAQRLNEKINEKKLEIDFLNERWNAFWNSRTGKGLLALQKVRQRVLPTGSRRHKLAAFSLRALRALKREGPVSFARAVPGWVNKRLKRRAAQGRLREMVNDGEQRVFEIEPVGTQPPLEAHTQTVDIIICVHNALEDVRRCLASVEEFSSRPYSIILVDDGSGVETAQFLADYAQKNGVTLLRSEEATGYTFAANRGLRASTGDYVVLLNSDTIVTQGWLDRMLSCAKVDLKIGIIGPLSNTASWQSVPRIEDQGDWAENPLPEGITVERMGELISAGSARLYPEMPLLNGFCLMLNRQLINEIGIFNEEVFGKGYGEEDDYALRARKAGWKLALADDTYIYHAQSRSYSSERRKMLSERAGKLLVKEHGAEIIQESVAFCHHSRVMEGIRARVAMALEREGCLQQGSKYAGRRILYLLPIAAPGGGTNVIRAESLAMKKMGVDVEFFNFPQYKEAFNRSYPTFEFRMLFGEIEDIADIAKDYDAVIGTYNPSVAWMQDIQQRNGRPVRGYYVQGFEPLMYPTYSQDYERAVKSYSQFPDLVRFTKTSWTQKMVYENTKQKCHLVGVSFDVDLYRPRPQKTPDWPYRPIRVSAMVRPEAPYREPAKTMQLLKDIATTYGSKVEIYIFGTRADDPDFLTMPLDFKWKLFGVLSQERVAALLNQVDIFIDYSSHQAMGLTALEAMSSGCAVVVPSNGGATSFARHEHNSIVVDTSAYENVLNGVKQLIDNDSLRQAIQRNAIYDVCSYFPERAALNTLDVLFGGWQA